MNALFAAGIRLQQKPVGIICVRPFPRQLLKFAKKKVLILLPLVKFYYQTSLDNQLYQSYQNNRKL